MTVRLAVVGTPGDRRVSLFRDAALAYGLAEPHVISWRDVLAGREVSAPAGALLRVESPGEDAGTDALLRGPGDPSRVGGGAAWYRAFLAGLGTVAAIPGVTLLADVDEIGVMFDKRRCHAVLERAGVPVPPAFEARSYEELRDSMAGRGWTRVFVKPAHGSSASGVIAFEAAAGRVRAITSAARTGTGFHNSLRVRDYRDEADVRCLVDHLAPDGLHVERWFPKASTGGAPYDLRVVTVGGAPTHAVVRVGNAPMTNLHLGGRRGDLETVRSRPRLWESVLDAAARAAACFPGSLMTGVDVMIGSGRQSVAVAEVNAFGDLLPGLTDFSGKGRSTYEEQVEAVLARWT
ncbi:MULTISPECIES: STM4014 family protein [Nonomuraea]|uniref:STM4014 family protein n=1 Tax=Nonomuraea ferruginea TaxID=46174 RepID=A0ABT4T2S8_9ACTN|nr:STM4014 family protein [Nonomuraea ferruginea]MDA0643782.1 STM4014 family protein [Nonomuraea ferruginea]